MRPDVYVVLAVSTTLLVCTAPAADRQPPAGVQIDFREHIAPLLRQKCMPCHDDSSRQGELRLTSRVRVLRGGLSGAAIQPGDSAESLLIERIGGSEKGPQMPPTGPLSAEQIGLFRAWIDQGSPWEGVLFESAQKLEVSPHAQALFNAIRGLDRTAIFEAVEKEPSLVKAQDEDGSNPLMYAAAYGDLALMREFIERGADPNATNNYKATASTLR